MAGMGVLSFAVMWMAHTALSFPGSARLHASLLPSWPLTLDARLQRVGVNPRKMQQGGSTDAGVCRILHVVSPGCGEKEGWGGGGQPCLGLRFLSEFNNHFHYATRELSSRPKGKMSLVLARGCHGYLQFLTKEKLV